MRLSIGRLLESPGILPGLVRPNPTGSHHNPSHIELTYHFDGRRYRYEIGWDERAIVEENLYLLRPTTETRLIHRWHDEETKTAQVDYDKHAMTMDDDTKYVIKTSLLRS